MSDSTHDCDCRTTGFCCIYNRKMKPSDIILLNDAGSAGQQARLFWETGTIERGNRKVPQLTSRVLVGDELKKSLSWVDKIKPEGSNCSCASLMKEMNLDGIRGCIAKRDSYYIPRLMTNKHTISEEIKAERGWKGVLGLAAGMIPDMLMKQWLKIKFNQACERAKTEKKKPRHPKALSFKSHETPSAEQNQLYSESLKVKPTARPFTESPTLHLVWHFWPIAETWKWHVQRLNELIPQINGMVIIGYVSGEGAVEFNVFRDAFEDPDRITFIKNINIGVRTGYRSGELQTAIPAFEMLPKDPNHVTLYGHGKGVRDHTRDSEAVRVWTEMMYETVTFNIAETLQRIQEGYDCFGSFRTFGHEPLKPKHKWHFSGSFYNFRNDVLAKTFEWQLKYGGTECWPGDVIESNDAYCVFRDNSPLLYQYSDNLSGALIAENLHWESSRFGDVKMEQHLREYQWLTEQLADCESILVIGSRHGGMEHYLRRDCPQITTIASIDIDPLPTNTEQNLIRGSSSDPQIQKLVLDKFSTFDAVFIDGDHSADGARIDWEFAKTLDAKRIFFHDFTPAKYHRIHDCTVHEMWPEVIAECDRNGWKVSSKVVGCGWGGIAQVQR